MSDFLILPDIEVICEIFFKLNYIFVTLSVCFNNLIFIFKHFRKFSTQSHSSIASHADDMNLASSGGNMSQTNSFAINSCEVLVEVDKTTHTSGSSAVATRNIINYPWELVYIPGNLVTVHSSGNFIAYAIQGKKKKK